MQSVMVFKMFMNVLDILYIMWGGGGTEPGKSKKFSISEFISPQLNEYIFGNVFLIRFAC